VSLPDHLVTGHPELDAQHQELFERTHDFFKKAKFGVSKEELRRFLGYLHDYTITHFRFEEALMRDLHYPAIWDHEAEHVLFWREVLGLMDHCESMNYTTLCGARVQSTVTRWLAEHIEKEDMALAQWIRAKTDGML